LTAAAPTRAPSRAKQNGFRFSRDIEHLGLRGQTLTA
jgi:hypothetical protein